MPTTLWTVAAKPVILGHTKSTQKRGINTIAAALNAKGRYNKMNNDKSNGYIAVDLDGTLATYHGWKDDTHIGEPIAPMVQIVKDYLARGVQVKIFTARVYCPEHPSDNDRIRLMNIRFAIQRWCEEHIGQVLPITNQKDYGMVYLYDDRCKQVIPNTGILVESFVPHI